MSISTRIVLKSNVKRGNLSKEAARRGWVIARVGTTGEDHIEDIWKVDGSDTYLHYIEDPVAQCSYLISQGSDKESLDAQARQIFPHHTLDSALALFHRAPERDSKISTIYLVALCSPPDPEDPVIEAFRIATRDPDPDVRSSAAIATGYLGWSELRQILSMMRESDASPDVRMNARLIMEGMDSTQNN
ncbi:HEAT repeat domain-containing protein [Streptomyces sp. BE147]|uniref:HEAT repeat domain-containing protein n=1 Tax=Streptomyces sp. BE147 TaxID=3002524 RepID=UPI002E79EC0A|nr:HEAT repeat domain-containing protein [Streptomyces sp. BE147]MEE1740167.1 HEAT repeat domain-containing protein [Streptomyces sp. BE147]